MKNTTLHLKLNGNEKTFLINPADTLLDFLRETAQLTGTKEGCGKGECGACTVLLDGKPVNSCLVMAVQAEGRSVTTIEGIKSDKRFDALRASFLEHGASQCGACTPGFIISSAALLTDNPDPTDKEIRSALEGNLCRCTGYLKIFSAVKHAAENKGER